MLAWTREAFESNQRAERRAEELGKAEELHDVIGREGPAPAEEEEGGGGQGEAGEAGSLSLYLRPLKRQRPHHAMHAPPLPPKKNH